MIACAYAEAIAGTVGALLLVFGVFIAGLYIGGNP